MLVPMPRGIHVYPPVCKMLAASTTKGPEGNGLIDGDYSRIYYDRSVVIRRQPSRSVSQYLFSSYWPVAGAYPQIDGVAKLPFGSNMSVYENEPPNTNLLFALQSAQVGLVLGLGVSW
jgi:hypothetical protein